MKIKKIGLVTLLACILVGCSFIGGAVAGEPPAAEAGVQQSQITVNGNGVVSVAPDQAKVSLGILTIAPNAQKAQQENATTANRIINSLVKAGIPYDKIETQDYSVWPEYRYPQPEENKSPEITAYRVSNTILVTIDDLTKVGKTIDTAVTAGANQVQSIQFLKKDTKTAQQEALQKACQEARLKAETIASALGVQVSGIVAVQESGATISPPIYRYGTKLEADTGLAPTPITPGELQVNANVVIVFSIS